jgi:hypothetical protein
MEALDEVVTTLTSAQRVDASPEHLHDLVQRVRGLALTASGPKRPERRTVQELEKLRKEVVKLPVVFSDGRTSSLSDLIDQVKDRVKDVPIAGEPTDQFLGVSPLKELCAIPVASDQAHAESPNAFRLGDLLPIFTERTQRQGRIPGTSIRSRTFYWHADWGWWYIWPVYKHWQGKGWTTVDGWDAADVVGGLYATAKQACETLPADDLVIALIKAACCRYASSTPEVPWRSAFIKTTICSCDAQAASGDCYHFDDSDSCDTAERTNTVGPVEATHTQWGGVTCFGIGALFLFSLFPGEVFAYSSDASCGNY